MNFIVWAIIYFGLIHSKCTGFMVNAPAYMIQDHVQVYTTSHNNNSVANPSNGLEVDPNVTHSLRRNKRNANNIAYWLYTRQNPTQYQLLTPYNIDSSYLDKTKVTVFLVHGWTGNGNFEMNTILRDAFLQNGDVNVIVVDWSSGAQTLLYLTAKINSHAVGQAFGQFLVTLNSRGLSFNKMHLIGLSLGGHLVGIAGRGTGGQVARITALDPAGPLWVLDPHKLCASDARYVEVIHTNTAWYGFKLPLGHADFYPNGGFLMPGCNNDCSHLKAFRYMADSVRSNILANQCYSLHDARWNTCIGYQYPMGNSDINKSGRGIFRVNMW